MVTASNQMLTKTTLRKVKATFTTFLKTTLTSSKPRVPSTIHLETSITIDAVKQPTLTTIMKPIEITTKQSLQ